MFPQQARSQTDFAGYLQASEGDGPGGVQACPYLGADAALQSASRGGAPLTLLCTHSLWGSIDMVEARLSPVLWSDQRMLIVLSDECHNMEDTAMDAGSAEVGYAVGMC